MDQFFSQLAKASLRGEKIGEGESETTTTDQDVQVVQAEPVVFSADGFGLDEDGWQVTITYYYCNRGFCLLYFNS